MAEFLFLLSIILLFYAFVGYPVMIRLLAGLQGRITASEDQYTPRVSMLLSVYNEEKVIQEKIENFLKLDYPGDKIELIVVSDGCTDRTEAITDSFDPARVRLFIQERRGGKTLALNRAADEARGEILVFTDANSMFNRQAIKKLVRHFSDHDVGLVSGRSVYFEPETGNEQSGGLYRRYEDFIKEQESATLSIVGADGAIYAMRKNLYEPLPPEHINDLIHPFRVVIKGYRAIHEPEAVCTEMTEEDLKGELNRQTRIMAQSWLIVVSQVTNLLKARCYAYLWAVLSHKVLRWLTLPLMLVLLASNLLILSQGLIFQLALAGQLIFYLLVVMGWNRARGLLGIPAMFILLHTAAMFGLFRLATGHAYVTWSPRKN